MARKNTRMKSISLTPEVYDYLLEVSLRESEVQRRLRAETESVPMALMQVPPEEAQLLALLVELIDARRCLEIGVFTGYSALAVAMALPADGRVVALDKDAETAAVARRAWAEAGVAARIDLRLGDAVKTLDRLIAAGEAGSYDFAFLDADKSNYPRYWEQILVLLRPGGLIAVDNVLWGGAVIDMRR
ncbi:MAG TPA: class I SAM-dependent methyltransferase, partial [Alphaproteobacteria bacterium]